MNNQIVDYYFHKLRELNLKKQQNIFTKYLIFYQVSYCMHIMSIVHNYYAAELRDLFLSNIP